MTRYVALDLETTSADPFNAFPVEIAAIEYAPTEDPAEPFEGRVITFVPYHDRHVLASADFGALAVNRYFERRLFDRMASAEDTRPLVADLVDLLDGSHLVGANPAYDALVLRFYLRQLGYDGPVPWHYRLFDVEAATAAIKRLDTIPSLSACLGHWDIERLPKELAHTAYGDAAVTLELFHLIRTHGRDRASA